MTMWIWAYALKQLNWSNFWWATGSMINTVDDGDDSNTGDSDLEAGLQCVL